MASPTVRIVSAASSGISTAELLLERHDELDGVEAVGSEVVDEARILGDLVGLNPEMLHHDLLHALRDIAHFRLTVPCFQSLGLARPPELRLTA